MKHRRMNLRPPRCPERGGRGQYPSPHDAFIPHRRRVCMFQRFVHRGAAVLLLPFLAFTLTQLSNAADSAPQPRPVDVVLKPAALTATELDTALLAEVKDKSEVMKNLEYLSDTIGPRL